MGKLILGIETSCDETAAAVCRGREALSNVISSQIEIHRLYGGVVPEVASRNHTLSISFVVKEALNQAKVNLRDLDAIAVTYGAGLLGALIVGVSYAKALSYALDIPLYAVNHIAGHIAANYIAHKELEPPFICLIASGGHTAVAKVDGYNNYRILGSTVDDAAGEAFDKVARLLGLKYPGGPEIDKLAKLGKPVIELPKAYKGATHLNFSYSGLKTAVMNYINTMNMKNLSYKKEDVAASFQSAALEMLIENAFTAVKGHNSDKIVIAGGVGANSELRRLMDIRAKAEGVKVYYPPLELCTDNAAMIACQGYYMMKEGLPPADLTLDADASLKLS
ncbi:MAG: tRNA (adenosine(37)-N6)-threonylcarbamoyltransferase complex transferase subunit TsaD [Christensenellales bacterium]|jgi:N6-L-threonylcarbamoyladenine synthase